ncbi:MAG: hypothetical protein KGP12_09235 [Actinomycetales bacterium]|nr:hypothetical protein [Actinomycetales bacterium]
MIRLGTLAGYAFEGPRALAGWTPPSTAAVYAILAKSNPARPQEFAVIYVGHADDLSTEGFPFRHPRSAAWIARAEGKYNLHACWLEIPGGTLGHREQIARELIAIYEPTCNAEKFVQAWKDEWIGEYETPVTDALTTTREPGRAAATGEQEQ